jgi:hypothetical protein
VASDTGSPSIPGPHGARRILSLAVLACVFPVLGWLFWAFALKLGPNDFHDYWLAGRLLLDGQSPYDNAAMAALAAREGLTFSLGGGYSYPLPFALAMIPFAALPFDLAVTCFNLLSLAAFGGTVAVWLSVAHPTAGPARLAVAALVAGLYPPVYGTVAMGQANLVLLPLMAAGLWLAPGRSVRAGFGGTLVGLAAIVKLVPGALVVPLGLARRWSASAGLVLGAVAALAAASAIAPWALSGSGGLVSNLDPDGYYTNQSINGFVSRLVMDTSRSLAPAPGAFDPRPVVVTATLGLAVSTLAVLWFGRNGLSTRRGLSDGLALALVAATIGAPKTSFWNESVLLLAVALVLVFDAPDLRLSGLGRIDGTLTALWFGSALVWAIVWAVEPARGGLPTVVNLAWSASLYGMLALWLMLARRVLRPDAGQPADATSAPAASPAAASSPATS